MFLYNCPYTPTSTDSQVIGGFDLVAPEILALINEAFAGEERGVDFTKDWSLATEIMMFNLQLLIAVSDKKLQQEQGVYDFAKLQQKYKIDCAREFFACKEFDIDPLLEFYELNT
jgi:hypothetical protein